MKSTSINSDVAPDAVIPVNAGIQLNQASGFRVQPGMTMDGSSLNTATLETTAPLARPVRYTLWRARRLHWLAATARNESLRRARAARAFAGVNPLTGTMQI